MAKVRKAAAKKMTSGGSRSVPGKPTGGKGRVAKATGAKKLARGRTKRRSY